jgi:hypothetical protein
MSERDQLIEYLMRYGGRCRDCADNHGVCPLTGIGCGESRRAAEHFVKAMEYATKHGFAAGYRLIAPDELDMQTLELSDDWLSQQYGLRPLVKDRHNIVRVKEPAQ